MIDKNTLGFDDLDGVVISNPADILFLTGFYLDEGLLLLSDKCYIVTDSRYGVAVKTHAEAELVLSGNYTAGIIKLIEEQQLNKVGFQAEFLSARDFLCLTKSSTTFVDIRSKMQSIRRFKKQAEIEKIKTAQAITDISFAKLLPYIKEGVTENYLRAKLEFIMLENGADGISFETIVASGINGACPHAHPSDKKVRSGEFITFDFGAKKDGYCSDMTRTVALGKISEKQAKAYAAVLDAHERAAEALKPGITSGDVDFAARGALAEAGLEQYFTHALGHGVGVEIHEQPVLSKGNATVLGCNDIVTVEPGVYLENQFGIRIENMYVITDFCSESLTKTDKKLINL